MREGGCLCGAVRYRVGVSRSQAASATAERVVGRLRPPPCPLPAFRVQASSSHRESRSSFALRRISSVRFAAAADRRSPIAMRRTPTPSTSWSAALTIRMPFRPPSAYGSVKSWHGTGQPKPCLLTPRAELRQPDVSPMRGHSDRCPVALHCSLRRARTAIARQMGSIMRDRTFKTPLAGWSETSRPVIPGRPCRPLRGRLRMM